MLVQLHTSAHTRRLLLSDLLVRATVARLPKLRPDQLMAPLAPLGGVTLVGVGPVC